MDLASTVRYDLAKANAREGIQAGHDTYAGLALGEDGLDWWPFLFTRGGTVGVPGQFPAVSPEIREVA